MKTCLEGTCFSSTLTSNPVPSRFLLCTIVPKLLDLPLELFEDVTYFTRPTKLLRVDQLQL